MLLAGVLSESFTPPAAVWTMVALIVVAGLFWVWFSWPARRQAAYTAPQS
jgi:hypothetical protein